MQLVQVPLLKPVEPIEARLFAGSLSKAEWTLRGRRNRLFIVLSGTGQLTLGGHGLQLQAPSLWWIPAGESGTLTFDAGCEGAALAIPDVTLGSAMPTAAVFVQVREAISRPILGASLPLPEARRLASIFAMIEQEARDDLRGAQEVIRHHLALLLLAIWRLSKPAGDSPQPSPRAVVRGFVHLAELHARHHWTVADYARALGVTADRLNTAVRRTTGRTPMELIHGRLLVEATTLLESSALQISEIAETLGFKDAAYFSRFFKRLAGISPRAHREDKAASKLRQDTSYAAWP